jgi:hypothetical protein
MLYALAYPVIDALTGHYFPAAPVFGVAPCPSSIFTAGLLLWTRRSSPMYVLVVPFVWLMTQTPPAALAMGVVADVARVPVGVLTAALLIWREYCATRERLIGGAVLVLAILLVGNDTLLMALGGMYLLASLIWWYLEQHRRRALPTSGQGPVGERELSHSPGV